MIPLRGLDALLEHGYGRAAVGVEESEIEQSDPIGGARLVTDVTQCRHRRYRHVLIAERARGTSWFAFTSICRIHTRRSMPEKKAKTGKSPQTSKDASICNDEPTSVKRNRRGKRVGKAKGLLKMPLDAIIEVRAPILPHYMRIILIAEGRYAAIFCRLTCSPWRALRKYSAATS